MERKIKIKKKFHVQKFLSKIFLSQTFEIICNLNYHCKENINLILFITFLQSAVVNLIKII